MILIIQYVFSFSQLICEQIQFLVPKSVSKSHLKCCFLWKAFLLAHKDLNTFYLTSLYFIISQWSISILKAKYSGWSSSVIKTLAALPGDSSLIARTHKVAHNCLYLTPFPGDLMPSWFPWALYAILHSH